MSEVIHDPRRFREACEAARARGARVGLVPTMGALHEGHLSLLDEAGKRGATFRVVTIFVNPLQFGEGEDFERYPRTLDADVQACSARGADLVFAPERGSMYPKDFQSHVGVESITKPLEGTFRPGHFQGVTTVVTKLFNLTGKSVAVFGRKDYQQWKVIERMVLDLDMPVEVVGHPIIREPDGLALSSRNRYLSAEERKRALAIITGLRKSKALWSQGERSPQSLLQTARAPIEDTFDKVDYVAIRNADTFTEWEPGAPPVLLAAAHLGTTRLIDNLELSRDTAPRRRAPP